MASMGVLLHQTIDQFVKARTSISISQRAKPLGDIFLKLKKIFFCIISIICIVLDVEDVKFSFIHGYPLQRRL